MCTHTVIKGVGKRSPLYSKQKIILGSNGNGTNSRKGFYRIEESSTFEADVRRS